MKNILLAFIFILLTFKSFALEDTYFKGSEYERPKRELSFIVTDEGFYPARQFVYLGEKVRIFVTSTTDKSSCLIIKDKDFFLEAKKGSLNEKEAFFNRAGEYDIYCPTQKNKAKITVLEHPRDKRERIKRDIASRESKKIKVWRPRDE